MKSEEFFVKAKDLVKGYALEHLDKSDTVSEVPEAYVVWFNYTLGNMKALLSTTLLDGMYYEVTYNSDKKELYLDVYKKFENRCVSLNEPVQTTIFDFIEDSHV